MPGSLILLLVSLVIIQK